MSEIPSELSLLGDDGIPLVLPTFGLTLYTDKIFSAIPQAVLGAFDKFLALCPPEELRWYATENMSKHKLVTRRTLEMLKIWLKPGAPPREYVMLEIKNGKTYNAAPDFRCTIFGGEPGSVGYEDGDCNLISMAYPMKWGLDRTDEMLTLFCELCALLPFQSGQAGFSFEWSPYGELASQPHAWAKSMRHRGIDIAWPSLERAAVKHDSVRGVGWLTVLSDEFVERLGGQTSLQAKLIVPVEVIDVSGGIILKAGSQPAFGDTYKNDYLPAYKQVYRVISPLIDVMVDRYPSFSLPRNRYENTEAWLRRFSNGS